jgi:hypothetical protein
MGTDTTTTTTKNLYNNQPTEVNTINVYGIHLPKVATKQKIYA